MDVHAHPHIGLSTLTYLFEGQGEHKDSLGNESVMQPGEVQWMRAGRGVIHDEGPDDELRAKGGRNHGVQLWLALPDRSRDMEPGFEHYAPTPVTGPGWQARVFIGSLLGDSSPVRTHTALVGAIIVVSMMMFDGWAAAYARRLPVVFVEIARQVTEFGKSGWFLWPVGVVLIVLAVFDTPAVLPRFARLVLAAWAVRLGFVFIAIALPGVFVNVLKRLIGRARPFVTGDNVWSYVPFSWSAAYASLPSGHATTAFSALVAIGALVPQARALLWIYAILIALSRVVVSAHYPSDVIAGAVVGAVGAFCVRN